MSQAIHDDAGPKVVQFLRKRDYSWVKDLARGACGKTVLLRDDFLDECFVCKKYSPLPGTDRARLFDSFVREIKLLHRIHHDNVVRVFNYYVYPETQTGYILMEHVAGEDIADHVKASPDTLGQIFEQAVNGFAYLEGKDILHRDIRESNLMVDADGRLKIIDFGFGKQIEDIADFDRSIELNWWCELPNEFAEHIYDFRTEVYFVGRLFQMLIDRHSITQFDHADLLQRMTPKEASLRIGSFREVQRQINARPIAETSFSDADRGAYQAFADSLTSLVTKLYSKAKLINDVDRVKLQLKDIFRSSQLEQWVTQPARVARCFIEGGYFYRQNHRMSVSTLRKFVDLVSRCSDEQSVIILANLHQRLEALPKHAELPNTFDVDDIPF